MTDKRQTIIDVGMELFTRQGFKNTSMQQIAEGCNIAKGSIYMHFGSKNELLSAIMEHLSNEIIQGVIAIRNNRELEPRERLRAQIIHQFRDGMENQQLMEAFFKESGVNLDEHLLLLAQKFRYDWQKLQEDFITDLYGDQVQPILTDLAVILNGIINEYYTFLLLEAVELDIVRLADVLTNLMDHVVEGMLNQGTEAIIKADMLPDHQEIERRILQASMERVQAAFEQLIADLNGLNLDEKEKQAAQTSLDLIGKELQEEEPNKILIQGMLANLRDYKPLSRSRSAIAAELEIKLI